MIRPITTVSTANLMIRAVPSHTSMHVWGVQQRAKYPTLGDTCVEDEGYGGVTCHQDHLGTVRKSIILEVRYFSTQPAGISVMRAELPCNRDSNSSLYFRLVYLITLPSLGRHLVVLHISSSESRHVSSSTFVHSSVDGSVYLWFCHCSPISKGMILLASLAMKLITISGNSLTQLTSLSASCSKKTENRAIKPDRSRHHRELHHPLFIFQ